MTPAPDDGPAWAAALEAEAPDVLACWRVFSLDGDGLERLRSELEPRVTAGSAPRLVAQQEAIGDALESGLRELPERLLRAPGGEEDWNVAQAFAHTTAARRFLATWAALDVDGSWPAHRAPSVIPSVPGAPDASRDRLLTLLDKSRRAIREAGARIEGHETRPCRLEHPLVGHLRCGEWLLFLGIHDLMHLQQLEELRAADADADAAAGRRG